MDFPRELTDGLDQLTAALDVPGTDLQAILSVLADDLTSAIPSFLGLTLTIYTAGHAVTLTVHHAGPIESAQDFLVLPLGSSDPVDPANRVVFYAETAGAFRELAADLAVVRPGVATAGPRLALLDEASAPEGDDLAAPVGAAAPGIAGLIELGIINQAIGVMLDRGRTAEQALAELRRQAHQQNRTVADVADRLLDTIIGTSPRPAADRGRDGQAGQTPGGS